MAASLNERRRGRRRGVIGHRGKALVEQFGPWPLLSRSSRAARRIVARIASSDFIHRPLRMMELL